MSEVAGDDPEFQSGGDPGPVVGSPKPRFLGVLGPGLITGASDDDPSGIATYSQTGAQAGFALLWLMPFTYPLMAVTQEISAPLGPDDWPWVSWEYPPALSAMGGTVVYRPAPQC